MDDVLREQRRRECCGCYTTIPTMFNDDEVRLKLQMATRVPLLTILLSVAHAPVIIGAARVALRERLQIRPCTRVYITSSFKHHASWQALSVDHAGITKHVRFLIDHGIKVRF